LSGKFPYSGEAASEFATGTPSLLRAINERSLLELIRRDGAMSRAEAARRSGLSRFHVKQRRGYFCPKLLPEQAILEPLGIIKRSPSRAS